MKYLMTVLVIVVLATGCEMKQTKLEGTVRIDYRPSSTQGVEESNYWYLYPINNYPALPPLAKGLLVSSPELPNGSRRTEIKELLPGDYYFKYFTKDSSRVNIVTVIGGDVNNYNLE